MLAFLNKKMYTNNQIEKKFDYQNTNYYDFIKLNYYKLKVFN